MGPKGLLSPAKSQKWGMVKHLPADETEEMSTIQGK